MEKPISTKNTRFADEYLGEIEIDSDSGNEFESCGMFNNAYRPSYVSQLLSLYKNLVLPLRGPFVFPEAVKAKMDRIYPEQFSECRLGLNSVVQCILKHLKRSKSTSNKK
jgi:hypothetical protein